MFLVVLSMMAIASHQLCTRDGEIYLIYLIDLFTIFIIGTLLNRPHACMHACMAIRVGWSPVAFCTCCTPR